MFSSVRRGCKKEDPPSDFKLRRSPRCARSKTAQRPRLGGRARGPAGPRAPRRAGTRAQGGRPHLYVESPRRSSTPICNTNCRHLAALPRVQRKLKECQYGVQSCFNFIVCFTLIQCKTVSNILFDENLCTYACVPRSDSETFARMLCNPYSPPNAYSSQKV